MQALHSSRSSILDLLCARSVIRPFSECARKLVDLSSEKSENRAAVGQVSNSDTPRVASSVAQSSHHISGLPGGCAIAEC